MASFKYRVKDKAGRDVDGLMVGEDRHVIVSNLQQMGYFVLAVEEIKESSDRTLNPVRLFVKWFINPLFAGARTWELAFFYRQFATMVKSGLTIVQALSSLRTQGISRRLRKIAAETLPLIQAGGALSEAFARYPWMFPELHISVLRAGEMSGTMDKMLGKIADYLEREHEVRRKLRLATFYPKLLILAVIFIPRFPLLLFYGFKEYSQATLVLLLPIILALAGLWVVHRLLYQIPAFRYGLDLVKLCVPKLGKTVRMLALSKFYRVVAAMYAAGASLSQALMYAANATNNWYLGTRLNRAIPLVEQGAPLSQALERTGVVPRIALDMISTGEQTGNIDDMLEKVAEYTENEAEVSIVQSTLVIGILLLLGIGAYIGLFVVRFYLGQYGSLIDQPW
jgi:type II secretory pathway component PulF